MKLYLIEPRRSLEGYYTSAVVCAMGPKSARAMHPSGSSRPLLSRTGKGYTGIDKQDDPTWPCYVEDIRITYLGVAAKKFRAGVINLH